MPYAEGRVIRDADASIMEMPGFLATAEKQRFRCDNFVDLMGSGLA